MSQLRIFFVCCFMLFSVEAWSQTFKVVSIRSATSVDSRSVRLQVLPNGELVGHAVLVIDLLSFAYDVPSNPSPRLQNRAPEEDHARYDIRAIPAMGTSIVASRDSETQERVKQALRRLLADEFGLVIKTDQKRTPVYALTVSSGGPRLQPSRSTQKICIFDTAPGGCHTFVIGFGHPLNGNAVSMDDLARYVENWTDLPVVNRTRLSGLFTTHTEGWLPMQLPPPPPDGNGHVDFSHLPGLSAVLSGLGLQLDRQQAVVPMYTVLHLQRPELQGVAAPRR